MDKRGIIATLVRPPEANLLQLVTPLIQIAQQTPNTPAYESIHKLLAKEIEDRLRRIIET